MFNRRKPSPQAPLVFTCWEIRDSPFILAYLNGVLSDLYGDTPDSKGALASAQ